MSNILDNEIILKKDLSNRYILVWYKATKLGYPRSWNLFLEPQ